MQYVFRLTLTLLLATSLASAVFAKSAAKDIEYKRSDTNFYWRGDVLKVDPAAVILTTGSYTVKGDSYLLPITKKTPKEIYVQVLNDWIEPITPPNMPASLDVAVDAMQIREPKGDVQVAFPSAPATFLPATDKMTIPNGAVVKTGADGTAAVLFGGVDSARLIPNSEAAVQQSVTPQARATEVDLTRGAVFSKVGHRVGVAEDYKVKTPFGTAAARGTDFVSVAMPARTDVWIAQGTVQLDAPDGKLVGTVKSEGTGSLKIVRFPVMADMHQAMMASSETMTAAMNFIPTVNVKIKALRDKMAQGIKLTPSEQDYLGRIKQVPCLIKLALVEPPAPDPTLTPHVPAPSVAPVPAPGSTSTTAAAPIPLVVRQDGKVNFQGSKLSQKELKPVLEALIKTTPDQAIVIKTSKKAKYEQFKAVVDLCASIPVKNVTVAEPAPVAPVDPAVAAPASAPEPTPAPVTPPAPAVAPAPVILSVPMTLDLRSDGKVDFQGATLSLEELKPKLDEVAKATPTQSLLIQGREKTTRDQVKKVFAVCKAAKLKAKLAKVEPATPAAPAPAVTATAPASTPAETLAPSTASMSSNAPPVAPAPPVTTVNPVKTKPKVKDSTSESLPPATIP